MALSRGFFKEISTIPRLTMLEERALIERIRQGDQQALDTLVTANLRLVAHMAAKYTFGDFEDRFQMGCEALLLNTPKFDPSRGKYSSFAGIVIESAFNRFLQDSKTQKRKANQALSLEELQESGDYVTPAEEGEQESRILADQTRVILLEMIHRLPELQRDAMLDYYGFEKIDLPNFTRQAFDQIRAKAVRTLHKRMKREGISFEDFM